MKVTCREAINRPSLGGIGPPRRRDDEPGPVQKSPPDLLCREVEPERDGVQGDVLAAGDRVRPREEQVEQVRVRHLDALRPAGRAGGEQHVGEPLAAGSGGRRRAGAACEGQGAGVQQSQRGRKAGIMTGAGQDSSRTGQLEQQTPALRRVLGVDGDVGAARPQDPEEGADRLPGARQADPDRLLVLHSHRMQRGGDARPGGVELGVGEPPLSVLDRHRAGPLRRVPADQLGDRLFEFDRRIQGGRC